MEEPMLRRNNDGERRLLLSSITCKTTRISLTLPTRRRHAERGRESGEANRRDDVGCKSAFTGTAN